MWIPAALLLAAAHPSPEPESFIQAVPHSAQKFKMIRVPDGTFAKDGKTSEIKNLWVGETELTFDAFEVWSLGLDSTPEAHLKNIDAKTRPTKPYAIMFGDIEFRGFPAVCMNYKTANDYIAWLNKETGRHYRLPTEAEWEYFARAGAEKEPDLESCAWYYDNCESTCRVGKKAPNAWGLKDVLGNAAEWCQQNGDALPAVRGGSWLDKADKVTFAARKEYSPKWNERDPQSPKSIWWLSDGQFVGMRLVCDGPNP